MGNENTRKTETMGDVRIHETRDHHHQHEKLSSNERMYRRYRVENMKI